MLNTIIHYLGPFSPWGWLVSGVLIGMIANVVIYTCLYLFT